MGSTIFIIVVVSLYVLLSSALEARLLQEFKEFKKEVMDYMLSNTKRHYNAMSNIESKLEEIELKINKCEKRNDN